MQCKDNVSYETVMGAFSLILEVRDRSPCNSRRRRKIGLRPSDERTPGGTKPAVKDSTHICLLNLSNIAHFELTPPRYTRTGFGRLTDTR